MERSTGCMRLQAPGCPPLIKTIQETTSTAGLLPFPYTVWLNNPTNICSSNHNVSINITAIMSSPNNTGKCGSNPLPKWLL